MNALLRIGCFNEPKLFLKKHATGFKSRQAPSIFLCVREDATCLTFLSKRPTEQNRLFPGISTFPLISIEENKVITSMEKNGKVLSSAIRSHCESTAP